MKVIKSGGVVLKQVASTRLYLPEEVEAKENLLFLRWNTDKPPSSIPLEATWPNNGPPLNAGYFLFLSTTPAVADAPAFEKQMRDALPTPVASGFAWVNYSPKESTVQSRLSTKLNAENRPVVDGNTPLVLLPGQESLGFGDETPIFATLYGGFISGFSTAYPPLTDSNPPKSGGVILPFTGKFVGCVQFQGLTNTPGKKVKEVSARKTLVRVSIDPLHPLDSKRNYEHFTSEEFILTQVGNSYYLSRA
jgi:hypothetical protein